ncbi:hypothetical protein EVAR_9949_1 [Eumeta japonica]|uniref:Uncharacterized protein n=1 Tax=Eumeta variegata TaxID=151549 RepID=A0A4C1TQU6_EUMVA|nr:hypothetical protein EVAR_9949_1 [Eumeta japonica]
MSVAQRRRRGVRARAGVCCRSSGQRRRRRRRAARAAPVFAMGWLERLRWWGGGARHEASVLVVGLDGSGKTSLLQALRPPAEAAHGPPRPAPQPTISRRLDRFHGTRSVISTCASNTRVLKTTTDHDYAKFRR